MIRRGARASWFLRRPQGLAGARSSSREMEREREGARGANERRGGVCLFFWREPANKRGVQFCAPRAAFHTASHHAVLLQRKPARLDHRQQLLHLGGEDGGLSHGRFCRGCSSASLGTNASHTRGGQRGRGSDDCCGVSKLVERARRGRVCVCVCVCVSRDGREQGMRGVLFAGESDESGERGAP